jgi:hypothetical protein
MPIISFLKHPLNASLYKPSAEQKLQLPGQHFAAISRGQYRVEVENEVMGSAQKSVDRLLWNKAR